ncbi:MAG: L-fucose:H+ symporter permease [Cyclobacteriaceae bacterium]|nr:L-fucose:H+ symporter permease [Cyclobacteriaceae bacterium]
MEQEKFLKKSYVIPFILLTACFAMWGAANNMTDVLLATFKKVMSMTDTQTSYIQVAFYGAYFCLALPAAYIIRRWNYKTGVLVGLIIYALGAALCYPASKTMQFSHFLMAFYIFAGGCAILETAVAPYIVAMGPDDSATRRINLAQAFNPIGSIAGIFLGQKIILAGLDKADQTARAAMGSDQLQMIQEKELANVSTAYLIVGVVGIALAVAMIMRRFPALKENHIGNMWDSAKRLLKNKNYVLAVVAQFFYVGVQIGVWSFTIRYVMENTGVTNEDEASNYYLAAIVLFSSSRFVFTALMKFINPAKLLTIMSVVAGLLTLVVVLGEGAVGVYALVGISGCMSLMFPTIYGIGLHGVGDDRKLGGSGLIMAIVGGAVITNIQAQVSDLTGSINMAYLVPLVCFVVITIYGAYALRTGHR